MIAQSSRTDRPSEGGDASPRTRRADDSPEVAGAGVPDYVRLAYERIDRTNELLARMESVLVAARRARG